MKTRYLQGIKAGISTVWICLLAMASCTAQDSVATPLPDSLFQDASPGNRHTRVFVVGELHDLPGLPALKMAFIRYAWHTSGITHIFMETGHSAAWLFNSYLQTGDTAFLTRPRMVYCYTAEEMQFWKDLYDFNNATGNRLVIHGLDFERTEWFKVMKLLRPAGKTPPAPIAATVRYLDTLQMPEPAALNTYELARQDSIYLNVSETMASAQASLEEFYGENATQVKRILFNPARYNSLGSRNPDMLQNVYWQIAADSIDKYLVFVGEAHANKSDLNNLMGRLSSDRRWKHHLADFAIVAPVPGTQGPAAYRAPYTYYKDTALIQNLYRNYSDPGSPFTIIRAKDIPDRKVARYSDYVILDNRYRAPSE